MNVTLSLRTGFRRNVFSYAQHLSAAGLYPQDWGGAALRGTKGGYGEPDE